MRAILIDPFSKSITEVDHSGDYKQIYQFLQISSPFTSIRLAPREVLFIDDEGLLKDQAHQKFFKISAIAQPLAGRGLILGFNAEGESVGTNLTLSQIKANVGWCNPATRVQPKMSFTHYEKDGTAVTEEIHIPLIDSSKDKKNA